jgi:hypothetical protein
MEEEKIFEYEFGGKTYIQKELVWGQVKQLASVLKGVQIEGNLTVLKIIELLGDKLSDALAVVLTEKGTSIKDKNLEKIAEEIEWSIPIKIKIKVIEDFFFCNPTALIFEKLAGLMGSFQEAVEKNNQMNLNQETTSNK